VIRIFHKPWRIYVIESFAKAAGNMFRSRYYGKCPRCGNKLFGGKMVIRNGPYGKFLGCSRYPKCKYTQSFSDRNKKI